MTARVIQLAAAAHRLGILPAERVRAPEPDPCDVLAQLAREPDADPIATGTPLDTLAADRIAARRIVILEGQAERGKTALLLATVATVLLEGGSAVVHVADRDPLAGATRLARLLGVQAAELPAAYPRLRVRTGPIADSVDMLGSVAADLLALDSLQAARQSVSARRDAAPHERVDAVLSELRRARLAGALVMATSEQSPSGVSRYSASPVYDADVLARCDRDGQSRFSVEVVKPHGRGLRWYSLHDRGWPVDATAEPSPAEQVARMTRSAPKRRRADNRPAMSDPELRERVAALLESDPAMSLRAVQRAVRAREHRVRDAYRVLRRDSCQK